jgi:hypothetical protein
MLLLVSSAQTAAASVVCEQLARLVAAVVEHGAFAVVGTTVGTGGVAGLEVQMEQLGLLTTRMGALLPQDATLW